VLRSQELPAAREKGHAPRAEGVDKCCHASVYWELSRPRVWPTGILEGHGGLLGSWYATRVAY